MQDHRYTKHHRGDGQFALICNCRDFSVVVDYDEWSKASVAYDDHLTNVSDRGDVCKYCGERWDTDAHAICWSGDMP